MTDEPTGALVRHIRELVREPAAAATDRELLRRFVALRDEEAFAELVRRHGAMVLGACRSVLRREHDAEDAFQAAFLALAKKAHAIRRPESLAGWLHAVACRLARKLGAGRSEGPGGDLGHVPARPMDDLTWRELRLALHEELARLPERNRLPLVLCHLEGKTQDEAARELGWTLGALRGRLLRGRELLRARLRRRGLAPAVPLLAAALGQDAAAVPPALARAAADSAVLALAGEACAGGARVAALADGALRSMSLARAKTWFGLLLTLAALGAGTYALAFRPAVPRVASDAPEPAKPLARTDVHGDPLPPGAIARLGTVRLAGPVVPGPDGKTLISVGGDRAVYQWDPLTGKTQKRTELNLPPDESGTLICCLTADGKSAAVWVGKGISVLDAASGKERRRIEVALEKQETVRGLALSSDGKTLAAAVRGVRQSAIRLWDVATGKEGPRLESSRPDRLVFSPDGKTLAASSDGSVDVWEVATGRQLRNLPAHMSVGSVDFSGDGTFLAAGGATGAAGADRAVKLWEAATGKERATLRAPGLTTARALAISPADRAVAAGGQRGLVVWDAAGKTLLHHPIDTTDVCFSPDGKTLYSRHGGSTLAVWDVAAMRLLRQAPGHPGEILGLAFAPDGKTVATGGHSYGPQAIHLWDAQTGRHLRALEGHDSYLRKVIFTPEGTELVSGSGDGTLRLWDVRTGREVRRFSIRPRERKPLADQVAALALSADGRRLVSISLDSGAPPASPVEGGSTLRVWDVATAKEITRRSVPFGFTPVFSPDASLMASYTVDGLLLAETATGREVLRLSAAGLGQTRRSDRVALSPDGRHAVTSSFELKRSPDKIEIGDRWLHLWELASGKEALRVDLGKSWHAGLAISPDGRILALAGRGSVEFRDVATGKELLRYAAPAATSWALSFSPGGDRLAAGYADATAMIWDATPAVRRAGPPARDLTARDLDRLWADLAGEDAVKAHDAVWALAAAPGQAVSLVRDRLKPAGAVDPDRVRKLIADLDSRKFEVREAATKELAQIGDRAEPLLRRALQDKPSAEARRRIEEALPHPLLVRSPEMLRAVRAIRVLEQAGTAEARQTLEGLAAGAEGARVTREAKAALERARKR